MVNVGVGPISGRYDAKIFLRDQKPYDSLTLVLEGSGSLGFANGESFITLVEQVGKTTLNIKGDTQIGGPVARLGQRMMGSVAQSMMDRFVKCLQDSV